MEKLLDLKLKDYRLYPRLAKSLPRTVDPNNRPCSRELTSCNETMSRYMKEIADGLSSLGPTNGGMDDK